MNSMCAYILKSVSRTLAVKGPAAGVAGGFATALLALGNEASDIDQENFTESARHQTL